MSNGYKLELSRWGGDNEVHLVFWDTESKVGDHNFILLRDGEVFWNKYDPLKDAFDMVEVNLPFMLLYLEKKLNEKADHGT